MKRGAILCCALALNGCFGTDDHLRMEAEHQVENQLKDPDSAKFKSIFIVRGKQDENGFETAYVCGVVDGKNSFGAYTGGIRFVVRQSIGHKYRTFDTASVTLEDSEKRATPESVNSEKRETIFESIYWNSKCVDSTHPATYSGEYWECSSCPHS